MTKKEALERLYALNLMYNNEIKTIDRGKNPDKYTHKLGEQIAIGMAMKALENEGSNKKIDFDKIEKLYDLAATTNRDFSLDVDADGSIHISINNPTECFNTSNTESKPVKA